MRLDLCPECRVTLRAHRNGAVRLVSGIDRLGDTDAADRTEPGVDLDTVQRQAAAQRRGTGRVDDVEHRLIGDLHPSGRAVVGATHRAACGAGDGRGRLDQLRHGVNLHVHQAHHGLSRGVDGAVEGPLTLEVLDVAGLGVLAGAALGDDRIVDADRVEQHRLDVLEGADAGEATGGGRVGPHDGVARHEVDDTAEAVHGVHLHTADPLGGCA